MRGHLVDLLRTALLSALLAVVAPCAPALALPTRAIVLSGEPVPGLPGQTFGAVYGYPSASGYVAISGNTSAGKAGVWLWDETTGGSPTPVAVPGPAPALSGLEISRAFVREMTSSGRLGYQASLTTGAGGVTSFTNTYLGIYDPASGHSIVAREGDPAPGIPGHALVLDALADALPQFNAAGQALFTAVTFGGTPVFGGGLWRYDPPGVVTPIVTATSDVPSIGIPNIVDLNDAGEMAYAASTGSVGGYAIRGPDGAGGTYEVVRTHALAPGTPSPGVVSWIPGGGSFSLNESGQLAFSAQLLAGIGDVTTANDWSVWLANGPDDVTIRFREGESAPGTPLGAVFSDFDTPDLDAAGRLAFVARLRLGAGGVTNLSDQGIWGPDGAGGLRLVAREGAPVPGIAGAVWGGIHDAHLGAHGEVLFSASNAGEFGIYLSTPDGVFLPIFREGTSVDFGGGDVRTIDSIIQWMPSADVSRVAITARFTDQSYGLYLVSIPEPGSGILLAAGIVWLAANRRRGR